MERKTFLTLSSIIALTVGTVAVLFPALLLNAKGTLPNGATNVWMTETGLLILASGITMWLVKNHPASATLQAFFIGNAIVQIGLCLIEVFAYLNGIITKISGIIPNTILHLFLAMGFIYYLLKMKIRH